MIRTQYTDRVLVVYPDIFGLRPLFDDLTAQLAGNLGRTVICVELFKGLDPATPIEKRHELAATLKDADKIADLQAAAAEIGAKQVDVMGFCMGGMYAFKAASQVDRAVAFYGMVRLPAPWQGPGQKEPLDYLGEGAQNVLALMGGRDNFVPQADIDALKATGANVVVYEEAEHGFVHDASRPSHRPDDAADAWSRALKFLH